MSVSESQIMIENIHDSAVHFVITSRGIMSVYFEDLLKIIGGLAGVVALGWRLIDERKSYLRISVEVDGPKDGWITVLSTVENKGTCSKRLDSALLLIGPEEESPIETANKLSAMSGIEKVTCTNDIVDLYGGGHRTIRLKDRILIPLPFFFSENVAVGDETLTYRSPIAIKDFSPSSSFSVRLFVADNKRLHRSTQDCFITESA